MPRESLDRVENYLHKVFDSAPWRRHLSILLSNLARERVVSLPQGARRSGKATTGAESFGWCERASEIERGKNKEKRVWTECNRSWAIPKRNSPRPGESRSDPSRFSVQDIGGGHWIKSLVVYQRGEDTFRNPSIRSPLEIVQEINFGAKSSASM